MSRRRAAGLLTLAILAFPAGAQETPRADVVDLAAVLRLAREASPRLAAERQAIAGAEADRITAGSYPNPTLNYGRFRPRAGPATLFDGTRQEQVTVDLPLLIAGQRGARVEKADREIEAARARVASGASTLAAEAGAAFVALQGAQELAVLAAATRDELQRLRDIVAGRADSGMASRYDVTRMDVEVAGARSRVDEARADVADRSGQLAALLGLPGWRPRAAGTLATVNLPAAALAKPRERAATSPALQAARSEELAAQSAVTVARRERWPVPSVSVGRAWTSEPFGSANYLGLSVELPLFDTRRGPLAKAESEATAATLRRELAEAEITAQLERYAGMVAARQSALQRHQQDAMTRLAALKQMAEDAYRLGRSAVFDLLDATRARHELQQTQLELQASLADAQLRYLALSGDIDRMAAPAAGR